jgi:hypothetical protein
LNECWRRTLYCSITYKNLRIVGLIALAVADGGPSWGWEGPSERRFALEVETGAIWQSRNEVRIPDNDNGTRFDLRRLQGSSPEIHRRIEVTWNVTHRHSLRFVYAPIGFSGNGTFSNEVRFAGTTFVPGRTVESDYTFDSYRLTYRYLVHESERWRWRIGATAFIRDAKIELRQDARAASDSNVGLVPLLSASLEYAITPRWTALVDFDGLISTQGRAIDAAAKIRYHISEAWYVSAGYRVFEGGVDNNTYAFGWYNVALMSLGFRF